MDLDAVGWSVEPENRPTLLVLEEQALEMGVLLLDAEGVVTVVQLVARDVAGETSGAGGRLQVVNHDLVVRCAASFGWLENSCS
jgi:hypothetical protein